MMPRPHDHSLFFSFGGTYADQTTYVASSKETRGRDEAQQVSLNETQFDDLFEFAVHTGSSFVFTVNAMDRYTNG